MRRIDARRGTENFKALFPTEFELLAKNQQGGPLGPPSSGRGLTLACGKRVIRSGITRFPAESHRTSAILPLTCVVCILDVADADDGRGRRLGSARPRGTGCGARQPSGK